MMGKTHALTGGVFFVGTTTILNALPLVSIQLEQEQILLGTVLTAGASLIPDLDHPKSSVSKSGGIVTESFSWIIEKVSGGHRNGTHSVFGVLIISGLVLGTTLFANLGWFWTALMTLGVLSIANLGKGIHLLVASSVLTLIGYHFVDIDTIVPWCIILGTVVHILGDMVTHGGCPLWYPHRRRYSLGMFRTNSSAERGIQIACVSALVLWFLILIDIL